MRIALFTDRFPELSETFITGEAQELVRAGHDVHVESAVHAPRPDPAAGAGLDIAVLADDTRDDRLRALAWLLLRHPVRSARDLLAQRRWRREEPVRPLRRLAPAARRVTGREHLHAHFADAAALDAMRVGALLGIPYSVATHGYDIFQTPRNLVEKHARAAFAVTPCTYSQEHLRRVFGVEAQRIVVGVDPERFRRAKPYPGGRTVIAIARLIEKKGLAHLVEAAARLREPARVVIVGDGPLRAALSEQVARLGLEDVVELAGSRTPEETRALLEQADVLAMPCVVAADGDRDTMPVVVKEALAMEIPVVASDEVGLPEVVRPEWGRLVPPGDADALARALDEVLALPPEERARMGAAGRAFVEEHCTIAGGAARLVSLMAK